MIAQPQGGFAAPAAPVQAAPLFQNQVVIDQLDQLCHRYQEDMVHGNLQVQVVAKRMKRMAGQARCACGPYRDCERILRVDVAVHKLTEGEVGIRSYTCRHGVVFVGGTEYWDYYHFHCVLMRRCVRRRFVCSYVNHANYRFLAPCTQQMLADFINTMHQRCSVWFSEINQ